MDTKEIIDEGRANVLRHCYRTIIGDGAVEELKKELDDIINRRGVFELIAALAEVCEAREKQVEATTGLALIMKGAWTDRANHLWRFPTE